MDINDQILETDFDDMDKYEDDYDFWQFNERDIQDPQDQEPQTFFEDLQEDDEGRVFIDLASAKKSPSN